MIRSRIPRFAAGTLLLALAGCVEHETQAKSPAPSPSKPAETVTQPKPDPAPAQKPAAAPKPDPAARPADVSVTGFETGTTVGPDGHIAELKTTFSPADVVHLAVLADGAARPIQIAVAWIGPDGARITEDVRDLKLSGATVAPFSLSSEKGLAPGAYKAEIRLEGWLASTAEFEVR